MNKFNFKTFFIFLSITLCGNAYAFPVAEGASMVSSLFSVALSFFAGAMPSSNNNKIKEKYIPLILFLIVVIISLSFYINLNLKKQKNELKVASQSRPEIYLPDDINKREGKTFLSLNHKKIEDFKNKHLTKKIIKLIDYKYSNEKIEPLDINFVSDSVIYQTDRIKGFKLGDFNSISQYIAAHENNYILIGGNLSERIETARQIYNITKKVPYVLKESNIISWMLKNEFSIKANYINQNQDYFSLKNAYDIRTREEVRQTKTLYNFKTFSLKDLVYFQNTKIKEILEEEKKEGDNKFVFAGYYNNHYFIANKFLKMAEIKHYFIEGGLKQHFSENKNITPEYHSIRYVNPEVILDIVKHKNKIRFICSKKYSCENNIPKEMGIYIPASDLTSDEIKNEIKKLDKDYLYVVLSSNQETSGNALILGFLLIDNGYHHLGEFIFYEKFSVENLRHSIEEKYNSIEDYRKNTISKWDLADILKKQIDNYGWFLVLFSLGVFIRLSLSPLYIKLYKSYYFLPRLNNITILFIFSSLALFVYLYITIDTFIKYYGLIDPQIMNNLFLEGNSNFLIPFILLIVFQISISMPSRTIIKSILSLLLLYFYTIGYFQNISKPMLAFLLGGEIASLFIQIPIYLLYKKRKKEEKCGIIKKETVNCIYNLPPKWKNINDYKKNNNGVLVKTNIKIKDIKKVLKYVKNKKIIVRSCSNKDEEQKLGGYYNSIICEQNEIHNAIYQLGQEGCEFVYVQDYIKYDKTGVATSISKNGQGIFYATGNPEIATLGKKNTQTGIIQREYKNTTKYENKIKKLIIDIEKKFKSPISIEFGFIKNKIHILQIRKIEKENINKIYKQTIKKYSLAEEYLAKTNLITGEMLELISNNHLVYIYGFMYKKNTAYIKRIYTGKKYFDSLKKKINKEVLLTLIEHKKTPNYHINKVFQICKIYQSVYSISRSIFITKEKVEELGFLVTSSKGVTDLEINGLKNIYKKQLIKKVDFRTGTHSLIIILNYLINYHLRMALNKKELNENISFKNIVSGESDLYKPTEKSEYPIGHNTENEIIVHGEIKGNIIEAEPYREIEKKSNEKIILLGEEIPINWVKQLEKIDGILSVYGNEASHLAISAKNLNIPYRKITKKEFDLLKVYKKI